MLGFYSKLSSEVYDLDKYMGRSFGDVKSFMEKGLLPVREKYLNQVLEQGVF